MNKNSEDWERDRLINNARSTGDMGLWAQAEIQTRHTEAINNIAQKIEKASKANKSLSEKIYYLNIILTIATLIMAFSAMEGLFK